jgi:hypothetical protein
MSVSRRRLLLAGALGLSWTPFALSGCNDGATPVDPPANGTGNSVGEPVVGAGNTTGDNTTASSGNTTAPGGNATESGGTGAPSDPGNTTGGGGSPPPPPSGGGAAPRVRYDIRSSEGQAMLAIYARGVAAMMALPEGDPRSWTFWWYTHFIRDDRSKASELNRIYGAGSSAQKTLANKVWNTCQSHNGQDENFFLPWHRMFVLAFENVVRQVTGEPTFTLPYWSYTDGGNAALPSQFRRPGDPTWGALYRPNRAGGVNAGAQIQPAGVLNLDVLGSPTYAPDGADQGFCANIDGNLHGLVHVGVGDSVTGMGVVPWAANDPIFWVHHCNIDRIWASWNAAGGVNPTEPGFTAKPFSFASPSGGQVDYIVGAVLTTAGAGGSAYDRLEGVTQTAAFALTAAPPPPPSSQAEMATRSLKRSIPALGAKAAAPSPIATPSAASSAVARLQGVVATPSITHIAQAITLGASSVRVKLAQAAAQPEMVTRALPASGAILKSLRRAAPPMVGASAPSARVAAAPAPPPAAPAAAAAAPAQTLPAPGPGQRAILVLNGLDTQIQPGTIYGVYIEAPTASGGREKILVGTLNFFSAMGAMGGMAMAMSGGVKRSRAVSFDVTRVAQTLAAQGRLEASPQLSFAPLGTPKAGSAPTVQSVSLAIQ